MNDFHFICIDKQQGDVIGKEIQQYQRTHAVNRTDNACCTDSFSEAL